MVIPYLDRGATCILSCSQCITVHGYHVLRSIFNNQETRTRMSKKVYISGQITGLELEVAHKHFEKAEKLLESQGHTPVNPMKLVKYHPDKTWQHYMREDIKLLVDCHAIIMLPNWINSKGAKVEFDIALNLGLEIYFA
jgi:hypothetical protein